MNERDWILCLTDSTNINWDTPINTRTIAKSDVARCISAVASVTGISPRQILGERRTKDVARARQIAYYVARRAFNLSYPKIGRYIGHRDHTSVVYGERVISHLLATDAAIKAAVDASMLKVMGGRTDMGGDH